MKRVRFKAATLSDLMAGPSDPGAVAVPAESMRSHPTPMTDPGRISHKMLEAETWTWK